ncbi:MAG: AraC family transcriptional regulator [Hyphomicrobiaceae bacterium]
MVQRSTIPEDYQNLPVAVAAMRKHFPSDFVIESHSHRRDQLIYAASGTMRVRADMRSWIVPPERALYMPRGISHSVVMRDTVDMRTLYIVPESRPDLPKDCAVITPKALLKELIAALVKEPENYVQSDRGTWMGKLILDEICRCKKLDFSIPMPTDPRLLRVCEHVIDNPGDNRSLAHYADIAAASERTLARICRGELEMGFAAWRLQVRFHYALEGLARGVTVGEVARACGYASPSAFAAAFRSNFGHPPSRVFDRISKAGER